MQTVLHTESSLGHGGQEIRTLAEVRWLRSHGWGALIACQPDSPLLGEAKASSIPAQAVRMRGAPDVGLVANIRGSKGHNIFLEAARAVVASEPAARLLIVGDGVGFEEVSRRVRDMGLDAHVRLTGFRRDIPEVMAALDVLVLPSIRSEAIPQVIPQALAVGTPVVASTVGGSPELIRDGESGRLVPPGDAKALADAILAPPREPERARAMARAGQALIRERYSIDATMTRTSAVYRELLDAGPRRRRPTARPS